MIKVCIVCGNDFEAKSAKGVYCGPACKMKHVRSKKEDKPIPEMPNQTALCDTSFLKLIEDYCGIIGMTPEELIADHKRMSNKKGFIGVIPAVRESEARGDIKSEYDPYKNPRFVNKMGPKKEE